MLRTLLLGCPFFFFFLVELSQDGAKRYTTPPSQLGKGGVPSGRPYVGSIETGAALIWRRHRGGNPGDGLSPPRALRLCALGGVCNSGLAVASRWTTCRCPPPHALKPPRSYAAGRTPGGFLCRSQGPTRYSPPVRMSTSILGSFCKYPRQKNPDLDPYKFDPAGDPDPWVKYPRVW